ncbi:hypothetical protein F5Y17DRAFT_441255 [Xylariaceae sp. FL0594]|nr:hypothetical protein F5Y17DRAFT_441255 [Xylariaceae sp. FL0594]
MAKAEYDPSRVIADSDHDDLAASSPAIRTLRPISPPMLIRASSTVEPHDPLRLVTGSPQRLSHSHAFQQSTMHNAKENVPYRASPTSKGACEEPISPASHETNNEIRPATSKKVELTLAGLEATLREFSQEIGVDHANLVARLIYSSWKRGAPRQKHVSKKDWFAGVKLQPVDPNNKTVDAMRIKTRQNGHGKLGKQEKREKYPVTCIQTNQEPVPRYAFHHVEIKKNILSPNTMLTYVPHLRDLADNEEGLYRKWLESLEAMDKTSGFATLSRHEKVVKTVQKERATTLLEYLDIWLARLAMDRCTKATLIRHVTAQSDAVTPQQKSSILISYGDDAASPRPAKSVRMFREAFDRVFNDPDLGDYAVPLSDVLRLDKSVDTIVDSKKYMKETPSQAKTAEEDKSVESFLETYSLLACLICSSHSCEHGEYGVDNERKRFSVEVVGGLSPMLRQQLVQRQKNNSHSDLSRRPPTPCGEDCYLNRRPSMRAKYWNETEVMLLRSFYLNFEGTSVPVQCAAAVAISRPCWDIQRQMDKLDLTLPDVAEPRTAPVRPLPWYDHFKKVLMGDWQEHTITHAHQRKDHLDPCHHDGPCDKNCLCVQNDLLCERLCRCTVETCARKFTGCACHSQGKTCTSKQRDRPCICIMLNRECDPSLCGSCGATERAMPKNADDDELHSTGCQNVALQRGKSKAVILGKSKITGYGLFTAEDIPADEFVIEYVGELISQDEGVRREARRGDVFDESSNSSYLFTLLENEGIWVDAAIYGNLSRYINHQDSNCNIMPKILYVNGEYRIKFTSLREIKTGEELFFHYGENFPNLTKKLLQEEKAKKKRRKAKEQAAKNGDKSKRRRGRKPGRKPGRTSGRKPKKTFASVESEWENEEANEQPEDPLDDDETHPQRKKRRLARYDTDSGEYQDDARSATALSQPPSVGRRKRTRLADGTFKAGSYAVGTDQEGEEEVYSLTRPAKKSRPDDNTEKSEEPDPVLPTTPKRRGRKPKNRDVVAPDDPKPAANGEGTSFRAINTANNDNNNNNNNNNNSGYTHTEARLELDEGPQADETPSRMRTRRSNPVTAESSPLSEPPTRVSLPPPSLSDSDSPPPQQRRRGRKSKEEKAKEEEKNTNNKNKNKKRSGGDKEYNGGSWEDSDGVRHMGGGPIHDDDDGEYRTGEEGEGEEEEEEDPVRPRRRRRRRRPARYMDIQ